MAWLLPEQESYKKFNITKLPQFRTLSSKTIKTSLFLQGLVIHYAPDGSLLTSKTAWLLQETLVLGGIYTVTVRANFAGQTCGYNLYFVYMQGANEHGMLISSGMVSEIITAGNLDSYTFSVASVESIELHDRIVRFFALPFGMRRNLR